MFRCPLVGMRCAQQTFLKTVADLNTPSQHEPQNGIYIYTYKFLLVYIYRKLDGHHFSADRPLAKKDSK
jgi:hypothetical protein